MVAIEDEQAGDFKRCDVGSLPVDGVGPKEKATDPVRVVQLIRLGLRECLLAMSIG